MSVALRSDVASSTLSYCGFTVVQASIEVKVNKIAVYFIGWCCIYLRGIKYYLAACLSEVENG